MRPRVLFVYDHEYPHLWQDGLWAALNTLAPDFDIAFYNLRKDEEPDADFDFVLGWGGFGSPVDIYMRGVMLTPKGLCIAGNAIPPQNATHYDVLFYETKWYRPQIDFHPNIVHAFGVNRDIYSTDYAARKIYDYVTVGAFADWKRQRMMIGKPGVKMAIGQIQRGNLQESFEIITDLLMNGIGVSDMVDPETLCKIYRATDTVYIPASVVGGGERAILEARACGCKVEIEPDNPKLKEILEGPIRTHLYYAEKLKKGILSCL